MAEETSVQVNQQAPKQLSLVASMAATMGMEAKPFLEAIQQTVMPGNATQAQTAAFLAVAHQYNLNPFIKEIYAFPTRSGGIQPIVSVDGWLKIMLSNPHFEGFVYEEIFEEGKLVAGKITIHRSDKKFPFVHTEWLEEAVRNTEPWNKQKRRMLENRTTVQGARRAFGISGIMEREEFEAMEAINITSQSVEMERTTATKTDALKDKIGAKQTAKATKKAEQAQQQPQAPIVHPQPTEQPELPTEPLTTDPALAEEAAMASANGPVEEKSSHVDIEHQTVSASDFDDAPENKTPITDQQRRAWLSIIQTRFPDAKDSAQVATKVKSELAAYGFGNSREITNGAYAALMQWANEFTL